MKIAFLTHEPFYPPSGGGSAEAVYLVQELVRRGHAVHLFCPAFADADGVAGRFGIRVHPFTGWAMGRYTSLRTLKYLAYPPFLARMVNRAARQDRFDVVLTQHAIAAAAVGWLRRDPQSAPRVVMNFLDYLTGFMEAWPRYVAPRPAIRALERFEVSLPVRHRADGVMTVSDTLADYFADAGYPRDRLRPIYYGYDAALFRPARSAASPASSAPVVVMHGSFDHHHLGPIASRCVVEVVRAHPEVGFRFVGRETSALQRFVASVRAQAPAARLECTGFVPYSEISTRLAGAAVGIVPYEESTGGHCAFVAKIVEYLAMEIPVVSTPLRSAKRYFGNEPAVRFSGFDGQSFGEAVLGWLRESVEHRTSLGRAASRRVQAELDWGVISRNAVDFVERVAADSRGNRAGA